MGSASPLPRVKTKKEKRDVCNKARTSFSGGIEARLQVLYSIRSERLLMEELNYDLLFRWY